MSSQADLCGDSQPAETTTPHNVDAVRPPTPLQPPRDPDAAVVRVRARADGEQGATRSSTCRKLLLAMCISCAIVLSSGILLGSVGDPRDLLQPLAGKKESHGVVIENRTKEAMEKPGIISKLGVPQAFTLDEEDQLPSHDSAPLAISSAANASFSSGDVMLVIHNTEELAPLSPLQANNHDLQNVSTAEGDQRIYANASFGDRDLMLAINITEQPPPHFALEANISDLQNASVTPCTEKQEETVIQKRQGSGTKEP